MAQHHGPPLPKIPGIYQSYREIKSKYPIGTDLEVIDKARFIKSIERRNIKQIVNEDVAMAMWAKGNNITNKRNWMVLDKEVLTFDAYYKSQIHESSGVVNCVIRKLKIIYFLVDDTIQVNEPMKHNSGSSQGCFIKKAKIPLPGCDRDTGPYYKLTDLVVGERVVFFGRELQITGVDNYTRDFLNKMGVHSSANEPSPVDPYFTYRKQRELDVNIKSKSTTIRDPPPNGLDHLVLRFRGYWDDRFEEEGKLHFYDVMYHLEDDTMELVEEIVDESNFNKMSRKLFVRKQRLPKAGPWCKYPGHNIDQEILNVINNRSNSSYYKMDNRLLGDKNLLYYQPKDLYIGSVVNVFNRSIVLVSCDEFTKDYYRSVFGLQNMEPIEAPKTVWEIEEEKKNQERVRIVLENQDEDMRKSIVRNSGSDIIFGFLIKMVTDDLIDQQRNFMLKYSLNDKEFAIYEFRETNSGRRGGMFRSKRGFDEHQGEKDRFIFHQLAVGYKITVDDFKFSINDIDDRTLKFMIERPTEFPHSNVATLRTKVREFVDKRFESLDDFREKCFQGRKLVARDEFRDLMSFDGALDPHAVAVFALKHRRPDPFEPFTDNVFRSVVQDVLRRARFVHFDGLKCNFRKRGSITNRDTYLRLEDTLKAFKSNKIPLPWDITSILFDKFTDAERGLVRYVDMVDFMDYITDPVELPNGLARELLFVKPKKALVKVDEFVDGLRKEASSS